MNTELLDRYNIHDLALLAVDTEDAIIRYIVPDIKFPPDTLFQHAFLKNVFANRPIIDMSVFGDAWTSLAEEEKITSLVRLREIKEKFPNLYIFVSDVFAFDPFLQLNIIYDAITECCIVMEYIQDKTKEIEKEKKCK
jgi:hypothetical protein